FAEIIIGHLPAGGNEGEDALLDLRRAGEAALGDVIHQLKLAQHSAGLLRSEHESFQLHALSVEIPPARRDIAGCAGVLIEREITQGLQIDLVKLAEQVLPLLDPAMQLIIDDGIHGAQRKSGYHYQ